MVQNGLNIKIRLQVILLKLDQILNFQSINYCVGMREFLGYFNTELEAFNAYKQAKESFIKEQANKWKGEIDDRAYEALMSYEVNIDD